MYIGGKIKDMLQGGDNCVADTTSQEVNAKAFQNMDIQGISWRYMSCSRSYFRRQRLRQYVIAEGVEGSKRLANGIPCKVVKQGGRYYDFLQHKTFLSYLYDDQPKRCKQNLVSCTSKHDVYIASLCRVTHWSPLMAYDHLFFVQSTPVLDLEFDMSQNPLNLWYVRRRDGPRVKNISAMAVLDGFLVVGEGRDVTCKSLNNGNIETWGLGEMEEVPLENMRTNHIELRKNGSGLECLISFSKAGSGYLNSYDVETRNLLNHYEFIWSSVNHTSSGPDGTKILVVGDNPDGKLIDTRNPQDAMTFRGHIDYVNVSAWHPGGNIFATGSLDRTCRIWDIRSPSSSIETIRGKMAAIDSISFTSDGKYMAAGERSDFVHLYDADNFETEQQINFFGDIMGISFSPDTQALFIGVNKQSYPHVLLYDRHIVLNYHDAF